MITDQKPQLHLEVLGGSFSVCKCAKVSEASIGKGFSCVVKTVDEVSIVCETAEIPNGTIAREDGWRMLKVLGPLDFGLVGVLAKISSTLADADVPLFAISTYDTDYILIKGELLEIAIIALRQAGCRVDEGR